MSALYTLTSPKTYLENGSRVVEIDNLDVALCCADYHERVYNIHRIDFVCHIHGRDWIWSAQVPILWTIRKNVA